eukprot:GGOE01036887.1.p1 GENE.GGOE01036887.1~~GGOE01036887.1.p1  ORF type:complete len:488 (-),score=84.90 GGOE01036887.1:363-1826(-)
MLSPDAGQRGGAAPAVPKCFIRHGQLKTPPPRKIGLSQSRILAEVSPADPLHRCIVDLNRTVGAPITHLYRTLQRQGHVRDTMHRALEEATGQVSTAGSSKPRTLPEVACQLTAITERVSASGAPLHDHIPAMRCCFARQMPSPAPLGGVPPRPRAESSTANWGKLAPTTAVHDTPFHQFFLTQVALRAADEEVAEELRGAAAVGTPEDPWDSTAILQLLSPNRPTSAPLTRRSTELDSVAVAGSRPVLPLLRYQGLLGNLEALTWDHVALESCLRPQTCPRWMGPDPDPGVSFMETCTTGQMLDGNARLLRQVSQAPHTTSSDDCLPFEEEVPTSEDDSASVSSSCSADADDAPTFATPEARAPAVTPQPPPAAEGPPRRGKVHASHMAVKQYPWPDALPGGTPPAKAERPWEARRRKARSTMLGYPSLWEWRRSNKEVRAFPLLNRLPHRKDGGAIVADDPVEIVANILSEAKLLEEMAHRHYSP